MCFSNIICSQVFSGRILDSITSYPISYANIVLLNGKGVYAGEDGEYEIDIKNSVHDTLKISSVGFEPKYIPLVKFKNKKKVVLDLFLKEKVDLLDEVLITTKAVKYNQKYTFGEKKEGNLGVTSLIGYETCVLIENLNNVIGKLKYVYVKLKKRRDATHIAMFNIKFYEFNKEMNQPGKELYHENVLVELKNSKYTQWVNVETMNIMMPKDGICIGVEMINPYKNTKKYTCFGPMFRYTLGDDNLVRTWSNYRNNGWRSASIEKNKFKRSKAGIINPMIGIEVLFPKKYK